MLTLIAKAGLAALALMLLQTEPYVLTGVYQFTSEARRPDGQPVCTERWTFADGILTVESGQEVIRHRARTEVDPEGLNWLVLQGIDNNNLPDCEGEVSADPQPGQDQTLIVPMNSGAVALCPDPQRLPNGAPLIGSGGCYGWLRPAS